MREIFAYDVPVALREKIAALFSDVDFKFPSVNQSFSANRHRILKGAGNAIALWEDYTPSSLDQFLRENNVPLFHLEPISAPEGEEDAQSVIGVRISPLLNVKPEDPMLRQESLPQDVRAAHSFGRFLSRKGESLPDALPAGDRPQALVAPRLGWLAKLSPLRREGFLLALRQSLPSHDLVLLSDAGLSYFEALQGGLLKAVVYAPFHTSWGASFPVVVTNDPWIAAACDPQTTRLHAELDVEGWTQTEAQTEAQLEEAPSYVDDLSLEAADPDFYLTNCHYFRPAEEEGGEEEEGSARFAGLRRALELLPKTTSDLKIARALPPDHVVAPESVVFEAQPRRHEVSLFDDRAQAATLTCILPFRYAPERRDALERLSHARMDARLGPEIAFLVVDDGSEAEMVPEIRRICEELGFSYIHVDSAEKPFSVGRCRNVGAEYARSEFIFMQDIDLMPYDGFYQDLLNEIEAQDMRSNARHFLMIPYVFLTQRGTDFYQRLDPAVRRQRLIHAALVNDQALVEKFSTGTSANVYNRHWYLSRGGNNSDFEGWGYEDIEFNTRMIHHLRYFPTPAEWALEKFNFNSVTEYRSYKAAYRLFGDMAMMKGIAIFHAWHPVVQNSEYAKLSTLNRDIFIKKLQDFPRTQNEPPPLPDRSRGRTLVFRKNAFTLSRTATPAFGEVLYLEDETALPTRPSLESFIRHHGVTRVLFFNPYQTAHMRRLQDWTRELGVPFLVGERGALPNSSFYDPNGFLADSSTYDPAVWNQPLTPAQERRTTNVLTDLKSAKPALENQPPPIGGEALRRRLGLREEETVVFIPLQRPQDSVTRFFPREVSYPDFEKQVAELASRNVPGLRLLIKTHPLEDRDRRWGSALIVDDANIYDLLEASDLVWTFNSGAGVLAMAWSRFCALSGKAFYAAEGVNAEVSGPEDVVRLAKSSPRFDQGTALRFLHHLTQNVYSFGEHVTQSVRMPDGARMTATRNIHFNVLRIEGRELQLEPRREAAHDTSGVLFDRYRHAMQNPPAKA